MEGEGKQVRLILGSAYGETAPIQTPSEMFYLDAELGEVVDEAEEVPIGHFDLF